MESSHKILLPILFIREFRSEFHSENKAGAPIPVNDVWIAAHALETGSILVSFDAHFSRVPGLRLWDYASASRD
jgi:predicted nucleic acid-binding protein